MKMCEATSICCATSNSLNGGTNSGKILSISFLRWSAAERGVATLCGFDGQSKSLMFRGVAQSDVSKNADKNTHNIDKMFDHFPPKK
jgi:hypothetical protein